MVDIMATGDRRGRVTFYDTVGEVLLHYDSGHNSSITAMDFDGQDGELVIKGG